MKIYTSTEYNTLSEAYELMTSSILDICKKYPVWWLPIMAGLMLWTFAIIIISLGVAGASVYNNMKNKIEGIFSKIKS